MKPSRHRKEHQSAGACWSSVRHRHWFKIKREFGPAGAEQHRGSVPRSTMHETGYDYYVDFVLRACRDVQYALCNGCTSELEMSKTDALRSHAPQELRLSIP